MIAGGAVGVGILVATVAFSSMAPSASKPIAAKPKVARDTPLNTHSSSIGTPGPLPTPVDQRVIDTQREREMEALREETRQAKANSQRQIDEEVRRQLDEKKKAREKRLDALERRESVELPPIESEIKEIQAKIETGEKNMARLRSQMQSLPPSSGMPGGSRFQPSMTREMRELELQGIQRWQKLQADYEKLRVELAGKLREAERKLQLKRGEFERERQKILADL